MTAEPAASRTEIRPATQVAISAVRQALGLAAEYQRAGRAVITPKSGRDIVTSADVAAEEAIRSVLAERTGVPVVGEERGGEIPADGAPYWLVDPLCGTRNYAIGTPLYSVNLALVEDGQVTAAVVGDPSTGEVLIAERGAGAWALPAAALPDVALPAEAPPAEAPPRRLATSADSQIVAVEPGRSSGARRDRVAAAVAELISADRWEFLSLATTLSLAYLAAGRLAAWAVGWHDSPVHCAAGSLLVTEAGGVVTDLAGEPWTITSDSCLAAADSGLHGRLLDIARDRPDS
jgi:myo-inositol-1(or 4)-monophosphatase